jgi:hypothetical protein
LSIRANPVSPPVTYSIEKNMKLIEYNNNRNAESPKHTFAGIDSILNILIDYCRLVQPLIMMPAKKKKCVFLED